MSYLKLKPEYEGTIITKSHFIAGNITFDSHKIKPVHYQNYANLGFDYLFDVVHDETDDFIVSIEPSNPEVIIKHMTFPDHKRPKRERIKKNKDTNGEATQ